MEGKRVIFGGDSDNPDDVFEGEIINYLDKNGKTNYFDVLRSGIPNENRWYLSDFLKPHEGRKVLIKVEILPVGEDKPQ